MFSVYTPTELAIVFLVFLFAATAKGITGLGFSTTCLPFLAITLGIKATLPLLIIPSIASNVIVMIGAGHFTATLRRFWPMFVATVPGLLLGLWLLGRADGVVAGAALGGLLIIYCVFTFSRPNLVLPRWLERPLGPLSGFVTGTVNGLTGSQVMPSLPFLMSLHLPRDIFIQAINCSFTLSSVIMAVGLAHLGLMTAEAVIVSTIGIPVVWVGVRLGETVRNRLDPEQFRVAVLGMLGLLGAALILRAV